MRLVSEHEYRDWKKNVSKKPDANASDLSLRPIEVVALYLTDVKKRIKSHEIDGPQTYPFKVMTIFGVYKQLMYFYQQLCVSCWPEIKTNDDYDPFPVHLLYAIMKKAEDSIESDLYECLMKNEFDDVTDKRESVIEAAQKYIFIKSDIPFINKFDVNEHWKSYINSCCGLFAMYEDLFNGKWDERKIAQSLKVGEAFMVEMRNSERHSRKLLNFKSTAEVDKTQKFTMLCVLLAAHCFWLSGSSYCMFLLNTYRREVPNIFVVGSSTGFLLSYFYRLDFAASVFFFKKNSNMPKQFDHERFPIEDSKLVLDLYKNCENRHRDAREFEFYASKAGFKNLNELRIFHVSYDEFRNMQNKKTIF